MAKLQKTSQFYNKQKAKVLILSQLKLKCKQKSGIKREESSLYQFVK
jgi:hypothetical protein